MPDDSSKPKISPTPDENPRENLAKWLDSVHAAARHHCASHGINGALHLAASAEFWLAVNGGTVVVRPLHPMPGLVGGPHSLGEIRGAAAMGKASAAARKRIAQTPPPPFAVRGGRAGAEALSFPSPMQ
jgi:hypothetical protein